VAASTDYHAMWVSSEWSPPDNVTDFNCFTAKPVVRTAANPTLTKARASSNWLDWKIAVDAEMRLLSPEDLHCYDTVRRSEIPKGTHLLHGKMDLKTKFTTIGEFLKHKARLVCLGNLEKPDPTRDLFSPTVNSKTINLMFALAAQQGLKLRGLEIYGAFITVDIEADSSVYMQPPSGLLPDIDGEPPIWKLRKTLYGLRRSPKAFYDDLSKYLMEYGYVRSANDRCLFHKRLVDG
jgi:hypothetical protein